MHWTYALLLVNPIGLRYRPAPEPGSQLLEQARALAAAGDLTHDDLVERYGEDPRSYVRLMQERDLARRPDQLQAPAGWVATVGELAVAAVVSARTRRSWRLAMMAFVTLGELRMGLRRDARRRAARRQAVTLADAPRLVPPPVALTFVQLGMRQWPRLRGRQPPMPSWPFWLAVGIVRELEERRSWRQAWRTSTGRPVSSDATPASDTAAAA